MEGLVVHARTALVDRADRGTTGVIFKNEFRRFRRRDDYSVDDSLA